MPIKVKPEMLICIMSHFTLITRPKSKLSQPFFGDRDGLEFFVGTGKCYLVISNTGPTRHYRYYFDDLTLPQNIIPNPQLLYWYHFCSFLSQQPSQTVNTVFPTGLPHSVQLLFLSTYLVMVMTYLYAKGDLSLPRMRRMRILLLIHLWISLTSSPFRKV